MQQGHKPYFTAGGKKHFRHTGCKRNSTVILKRWNKDRRLYILIQQLFIILLVALCLLLVWFIMYKSNFGKQMRAVMQNRTMAKYMGINSRKVDNITFAIGLGLTGIAGCLVALLGSIDSTVGQSYIVNSFMAVVLGGVGKLLGTAIGSVIIGSASIFTENYTSSTIAKAIVLLIVIIFLQKRPQGLFVIKSRYLDD